MMRRSRAPLALMELTVMLLVFALAAALCIQAFVASSRQAGENGARDTALRLAQTAAETLKASGGSAAEAQLRAAEQLGGEVSQGIWYVLYDENWNVTDDGESSAYRLEAAPGPLGGFAPAEGLVQMRVRVAHEYKDAEELVSLPVAWQEVSGLE